MTLDQAIENNERMLEELRDLKADIARVVAERERLRAANAELLAACEACASIEPPYNEDEGFESTYIDGYLKGWYDHCDAIRARGERAIRVARVGVGRSGYTRGVG